MVKTRRVLSLMISLLLAGGIVLGLQGNSYAAEKTVEVDDLSSFARALQDYATHIVVTKDIDFNCLTAEPGVTARNTFKYSLTIEGANPSIKLRRVLDKVDPDMSKNGEIQSLFGITGGGAENNVIVTFKNITLDGGADFGSYTGYNRVTNYNNIIKLGGVCGRSLLDVYAKGVLNLENGVTIQNCYCTNSMSALNTTETSSCYGAAVRVEFASKSDGYGGTVNMYEGATIKNCVASNRNGNSFGGAIGAYSFGSINMYGGTIENCSAYYGGAVSCNYTSGLPRTAAVFTMKGNSLIKNCSAMTGGALYFDGAWRTNDGKYNALLGGSIENCQAQTQGSGSALALGAGSGGKVTPLKISQYDEEDGPFFVKNCTGSTKYTDPNTKYGGKTLRYKWLDLGNSSYVEIGVYSCKVKFMKKYDDTDPYLQIVIEPGSALGDSFPGNPAVSGYTFIEWNTKYNGEGGATVTKTTVFNENTTVYARWVCPPTFTATSKLEMTYGTSGSKISVNNASSPYGGSITYKWYSCNANGGNSAAVSGQTKKDFVIPDKTAAGTYYFKCFVSNKNGSAQAGVYTEPIKVIVYPKNLSITWKNTEFTYNGNTQAPSPSIASGGVLTDDKCYVRAKGGQRDAGSSYTAQAELYGDDAANYKINSNGTCSFKINKKSVDLSWSSTSFTYDGTYKTPKVTMSGNISGTDVSISVTGGNKKDAGKYNVSASLAGTDSKNYSIASGKDSSFMIDRKTVNISWSDTAFDYDGQVKTPKATVLGVVGSDDCSVTVEGGQSAAGTYTATAVLTGKDAANYVIASGDETTSFTITKPSQPDVTPGGNPSVTPADKPTTKPSVSLTLDKKTLTVTCGKNATLKATLKGASSNVSWKSSDAKIASVDSKGKITGKMAGTVTITASAAGKTAQCTVTVLYKDVINPNEFWFGPTNYLTAAGVVKGYDGQTTFKPANDCTRAQMVTFLYRLQGEPKTKSTICKFPDVKSSDYFFKPVIWAVEQGITTGYSDGNFKPKNVCTRAQTVTFLWRMANKPAPSASKNPFSDVKKGDYYYKAVLWASEKKIVAGYDDGTFKPEGKCLRRQMVTFLYKYDKYVNGKG